MRPSKAEAAAAVVRINRAQRVVDAGGTLTSGERVQVRQDTSLLTAYAGDDLERSREIVEALT